MGTGFVVCFYEKTLSYMEDMTMAYIISDDCISCGNCAENCPTEAIYEGDGKYEIDPDKCVDCGTCADSCPVEAAKAE